MKKSFAIVAFVAISILTGCSNQSEVKTRTINDNKPLRIVTSFYPLYEIAHQIGGDLVTVKNIVPGGTEPHDYEPTARDIIDMREADLVIYNGLGLEPWKDKIIPDLQKNNTQTIQMSDLLKNVIIANDPHLWLDPLNYKTEAEEVSKKIIELDPVHANTYKSNTEKFTHELDALNIAYTSSLKTCKFDTFIANHGAFAYLAKQYHLYVIPIAGLSPDIEPSPKTMADITNLITQKGIHYILTETLVSPKISDTLARSSGAKTLPLNPLEGLTNEETSAGKNYISIMKDNLISLRTALECK